MFNKKNLLTYCLAAGLILMAILVVMAGCKRTSTTIDPARSYGSISPGNKIEQYNNPEAVITAGELNNLLREPNLFIFDARHTNAKALRAAAQEGFIPGSIAYLRSHYSDLSRWNRAAPAKHIQKYFSELGLDRYSRIVIYGSGNGLEGRLYWVLKMYGCDNQIQILDGGIEKWKDAGYQLSTEKRKRVEYKFEFNPAKADPGLTCDLKEINNVSQSAGPDAVIIDARSKKEYAGGHIPSSVNVSLDEVLNPDKTFKPLNELGSVFGDRGITPEKNVYVYSNNGARSSLLWYVLHELMGYPSVKNYDSGLKEWNFRERPLEKGEPQVQ